MVMENTIQIIKPEPDSQFKLLPCPVCKSDNVAYVQKAVGEGELWHGMCFDCGYTGKGAGVRHESQKHWNKREGAVA